MAAQRTAAAATCDLGELALALVVRSLGYALLGVAAAVVAVMVNLTLKLKWMDNHSFWPLAFAVWALLQLELLIRLRRVARQAPAVSTTNHTIHKLELSTASFLFLFWLARPYLIEADASSYPYLQRGFQGLIGLTAFFHILVLAIFRAKPNKWDAFTLIASVAAALAPFIR